MGRRGVDNGSGWEESPISRSLKTATIHCCLPELQNNNKRGSKPLLPVHSGIVGPPVVDVSYCLPAILRRTKSNHGESIAPSCLSDTPARLSASKVWH